MKKKFGSSIVEQIERENNPTAQAAFANMSAQRYIDSLSRFKIFFILHACYSRRAYQALQQQQQRPTTRIAKQNAFITSKLGWPVYHKFGKLTVELMRRMLKQLVSYRSTDETFSAID